MEDASQMELSSSKNLFIFTDTTFREISIINDKFLLPTIKKLSCAWHFFDHFKEAI